MPIPELLTYLESYGSVLSPQEAEASRIDNQIKSIYPFVGDLIFQNDVGTIIDIGAGNGILLNRLTEDEVYLKKNRWSYLAIDDGQYKGKIFDIAIKYDLHKRTDFMSADDFYSNIDKIFEFNSPHIYFIRNVFHELNITETALLLHTVLKLIDTNDFLIIQDLKIFPRAENNNACWDTECFKNLLSKLNYTTYVIDEESKSGAQWFNIKCTLNEPKDIDLEEVTKIVIEERYAQWNHWSTIGILPVKDETIKDFKKAKLDFDLQYAALTRQLQKFISKLPPLSNEQELLLSREIFKNILDEKEMATTLVTRPIYSINHFVNRANNLDKLSTFLANDECVAIIYGPSLMGKTSLVNRSLSRVAHNRTCIYIDALSTYSAWNIIEIVLTQLGFKNLITSYHKLKNLDHNSIYSIFISFLEKVASKIIIVFDHFENFLNFQDEIDDAIISKLFSMLYATRGIKVIITTRVIPSFFKDTKALHPVVARFPDERNHVINLLKNFINAQSFPNNLIEAIDRHPYLAYLTGIFIENKGVEFLNDEQFINKLRNHLKKEILNSIMDNDSMQAIYFLSATRIPIPRAMLVALCNEKCVTAAEHQGLIIKVNDLSRPDLITALNILKNKYQDIDAGITQSDTAEVEHYTKNTSDASLNKIIANAYCKTYRDDDDPKWLRECHFHKFLAGDIHEIDEFGIAYRSELLGCAEYLYHRKKDYKLCLWAYSLAEKYGDISLRTKMRIAACNIRTGNTALGCDQFEALIEKFQHNRIKSAYIDSILYIKNYIKALSLLNSYGFSIDTDYWTAGQFGRTYSGLHKNTDAITAFKKQLAERIEVITLSNLIKCYHRTGDNMSEYHYIMHGLQYFSESPTLLLARASYLIRTNSEQELHTSLEILESLYGKYQYNNWIFYQYTKCLLFFNRVDEVISIWRNIKDCSEPELLKPSINAEILLYQKKYEEAISCLQSVEHVDEHIIGQVKEIYVQWANQFDNDNKIKIASEGLGIPIPDVFIKNVPLLVTSCKLALLAKDQKLFKKYSDLIIAINPNVKELNRLIQESKLTL